MVKVKHLNWEGFILSEWECEEEEIAKSIAEADIVILVGDRIEIEAVEEEQSEYIDCQGYDTRTGEDKEADYNSWK